MEEEFPVVGRVRAIRREVHDFVWVKIFCRRLDDPRCRLVALAEAEPAGFQLHLSAHQRRNAFEGVINQLSEVAHKRVVKILEVELPELKEPQRQRTQIKVE